MTDKELIEVLGRLTGEADAPAHRRALRRTLLSQPRPGRFAALQSFITISVMKKYYVPLALVALVVFGTTMLNPNDPAVAQAQEQVARSFARAIEISPEMRAELEAKMKADMLETLEEAKAAPDLRVLTKEEFEKESSFSFSTGPVPTLPAGAIKSAHTVAFKAVGAAQIATGTEDVTFTVSAAAPQFTKGAMVSVGAAGIASREFSEPVKYLSYTDPKGNKTVLGLDKNDTPVFKFSTISSSDIIKFENGAIGVPAVGAVKVINIEHTEPVTQ